MNLEEVGIVAAIAAGLGGLLLAGFSLFLHWSKHVQEQQDREKPASLWVRQATLHSALLHNHGSDTHIVDGIDISVGYIGGGHPLTVFGASLSIVDANAQLSPLMRSAFYVGPHQGGDFTINYPAGAVGIPTKDPNFKTFVLLLDCGGQDFRELTFAPALLPDGTLTYLESARENEYHYGPTR